MPLTFVLSKTPPASWLGQAVTVAPGCDKSLFTCDNRYLNVTSFGGFGTFMPVRNVVTEME